jgi:hypothetical protein
VRASDGDRSTVRRPILGLARSETQDRRSITAGRTRCSSSRRCPRGRAR